SRHPTGSGIGLAVTDQLVAAMGGTLALGESAHGGLRAVVLLPRAVSAVADGAD
ncbi:MAG: two-component sensor histidine kinase, partial [Gemmatimonadetes bacterium]|nr:two-component sensor histidine kinase [Gemmatimonadota bacterium]